MTTMYSRKTASLAHKFGVNVVILVLLFFNNCSLIKLVQNSPTEALTYMRSMMRCNRNCQGDTDQIGFYII